MLNAETKRHIDAARDVLVGVAPNPMTQVDQITYALIYKFMDDMDQSAIKLGGEPSFFVGDLAPYAYSKLMDSRLGNQERMNLYAEALTKFAEAKQLPELFRTIFRAAFLPYRSPETLGLFLKEINFFDYSHPEELGNAYEYLLSIMSAQGDAGQFRTPRHIIDFMVDVLDPSKTDRVLDPACGTGGFLVSSYNHILEKHDGKDDPTGQEKPLTPDERRKLMENFEGYDIDPSMVRIAQVNMYLHLFKNPKIFQYDSLTSEDRWNDKFDVILANPPFMSPKGGIKPHNKFGIKSNRSELLFVDYILNHLKPRGRAGIIVPDGLTFIKDTAYKDLRKNLLELGLCAVVSLPSGVFRPYSGVKTSILFIDKDVSQTKSDLAFFEVDQDGFDLGSTKKSITENDLPEALAFLRAWFSDQAYVSDKAFIVPKSALEMEGAFTLNSRSYRESEIGHRSFWPQRRLGELCRTVTPPKKLKMEDVHRRGRFPVIDQSVNAIAGFTDDESALIEPEGGVVIFGDHTCAVKYSEVPFGQGADGIKILKFDETVLPKFAFYAIKGANFESQGYRRHFGDLKNLELPLPPMEVQAELVAELDEIAGLLDGAENLVRHWNPKLKLDPNWPRVQIGSVATLATGGTPSTSRPELYGGDIKWLVSGDIHQGEIYDCAGRITDLALKDSNARLLPVDSVLIALNGQGKTRGTVAILRSPAACNQSIVAISPDTEQLLPEFLYWQLRGAYREIRLINGENQRAGLNMPTIRNIEIAVPPIEVQRRLVNEIGRERTLLESAIELKEIYVDRFQEIIGTIWDLT